MFDAHTHIQFPAYDTDRVEVLNRAKKAGVKMVCVGTQISTSHNAVMLSEKYPNDIWATVGFHPNHSAPVGDWHHDTNEQSIANPEIFNLDALAKLAEHEQVVAIGECGLDYYRITADDIQTKEAQKKIFIDQAHLALSVGKPLMIHCRPSKGSDDAYQDLFTILSAQLYAALPKILHFYVGSVEMTKRFSDAGYYFTFGGVITFPPKAIPTGRQAGKSAGDYDEIIKLISLERILLETDAPYVAPEQYRSKRNEPAYIIETAKKMAELKDIFYNKLEQVLINNAKRVFDIDI